jgi:hypothetical protein
VSTLTGHSRSRQPKAITHVDVDVVGLAVFASSSSIRREQPDDIDREDRGEAGASVIVPAAPPALRRPSLEGKIEEAKSAVATSIPSSPSNG